MTKWMHALRRTAVGVALSILTIVGVAPAFGATYWVSPTGTSGASGADSTTNAKSLAWVNANANSGDVVRFKSCAGFPGGYVDPIAPTRTNVNASRMRFYGFPEDPSAVVVSKIYFKSVCAGQGRYMTARWITSASEIIVDNCYGEMPARDSIVACRALAGGLTFRGRECVADSLNVTWSITGNGQPKGIGMDGPYPSDTTSWIRGCEVKHSTFNFTVNLPTPQGDFQGAKISAAQFCTISDNTFNISITRCVGFCFALEQYHAIYTTIARNRFNVTVNGAIGGATGLWCMRDSTWNTRILDNVAVVTGSGSAFYSMTTNSGSYGNSTGRTLYSGNDIRIDNPGPLGVLYWQNGSRNDTLQFNTIRTSSPYACIRNEPGFGGQPWDGTVVRHNTLMTAGGTAIDLAGSTVGNSPRIVSGVYYSTGTTSAGNELVKVSGGIRVDSAGVYFARGGSAATAIAYNGTDGAPGTGGNFGVSGKALWCSPQFVDSSYATFDAHLRSGSCAQGGTLQDGFAGALGVTVDTCTTASRPGRVNDLGISAITPSTLSVSWTEPGSDQYATNDSRTSYELRSSASTITEANWSSATIAASGELSDPGTHMDVVGASGLSPGTTRYFAVRYTDGDGNVSCLSNVTAATTADNTAPERITNLAVTSTAGSTASLSWTAPGDDGSTGTATSYAIRYRLTNPIVTEADWSASSALGSPPTPQVAGSTETATVTGLTSDRLYYFAVRATDDVGNVGAVSNSPSGVTLDVTAPAAISNLTTPSATANSITLRWTAPGDDGSVGTATSYDVRYVIGTAITNDAAFAAATQATGEPAPQIAGTLQSFTVTGLSSGTTYAFAMKTTDEAGNVSALSNSASRATVTSDVTRPAAPLIQAVAMPGVADGALVTFLAVGDDSLTGTATSYDLRYRTDTGPTAATWADLGVQSITYRAPATRAPRAAGTADTITVRNLRPGASYWFALTVTDDVGQTSALSNAAFVTLPAAPGSDYAMPAPYTYGGAGSGSRPPWFPYVGLDGAAVDTAACRAAAVRVAISFCPDFADSATSYGKRISLAALQTLRAVNPAIRLYAEPIAMAAYYRGSSDSTNVFQFYDHLWSAVRDSGGGWQSGTGAPGGAWTAGGYADSTGSSGFLWTKVPGYRGWFYGTVQAGYDHGASAAGIAGNTTWNVNLAYQPAAGRFPVAAAIAKQVVNEYVLRKNPDGTWTWDGVRWDLFIQDTGGFPALAHDSIDYVRAGYSTRAAFDTAWIAASHQLVAAVRRAANDAGRPGFVLSANGGSGTTYDEGNGHMRESAFTQQGGTWWTNVFWYPGGLALDAERYAYRTRDNVVFGFKCANDSCPSPPDTAAAVRQQLRLLLGTATLFDAAAALEPQYASAPKGGGFERAFFDEFAVDTITAKAAALPRLMGYLRTPRDRFYMTTPTSGLTDLLQGSGSFESGQVSLWTRTSNSQVTIGAVTDTVRSGSSALRARIGTRQAVDYGAVAQSNIRFSATTGDTVALTFWAKADIARPIQVGLLGKTTGALRSSWSANCRMWIYPVPGASASTGWRPYRLTGTIVSNATASESLSVAFWFGDTTGTVWLDDISVTKGRARGGLLVREFQRGAVIVNPYARTDTVTFGVMTRRILAADGVPASVNTGELLAAGAPIVVPANDARFVLFPVDSLRPSQVTDLLAGTPTSSSCRVSWTAPGDDSLSGTPTLVAVRVSASPISSESDWTNATPVPGVPAPVAGGTAQSFTVTGLSPSTVYYFALRAYDDAGFFGAISNSDSVLTRATGTAPNAAFSVAPASGYEPLAITLTDQTTNTPTVWEWYLRRTNPAGDADPQISADQNPTFTLNLGGTYTVSLQASNDFGTDTTLTTVVVYCTPPSPITSITATPIAGTGAQVTYKETGDDGDTGVPAEILVRYVEGNTFTIADWDFATPVTGVPMPTAPGTTAGVVVSGLDPGKTYAFVARAMDSGGCLGAIGTVAVMSTISTNEAPVGVEAGSFRVRVRVSGRR